MRMQTKNENQGVLGMRLEEGKLVYYVFFLSLSLPQGPDAKAAMQKLCTNNMAVAPGSIVYTGMLNRQGGYQTDCTVTRLSQNKLVFFSPTHSPSLIAPLLFPSLFSPPLSLLPSPYPPLPSSLSFSGTLQYVLPPM